MAADGVKEIQAGREIVVNKAGRAGLEEWRGDARGNSLEMRVRKFDGVGVCEMASSSI